MHSIRKIKNDTELNRILNRDFVSPIRSGYIEVGENNLCLPVYYQQYEETIRKFEVHDDDVFIAGHPRTGSTWTEEMVWLIVNNLDFAKASQEPVLMRSALLELYALFDYEVCNKIVKAYGTAKDTNINLENPFSYIEQRERPRCIKTHLHWSLLPEQIRNGTKKPKIITVLRNAADTCVSYYYLCQTIENYKGTFEDFCELFLAGKVSYGPFWKQVLSYWEQRHRSNILFITFKEMKEDQFGVIKRVSKFLGKSLTEEQIEKLAKHLSFDSMRNNSAVNLENFSEVIGNPETDTTKSSFIRSGKVGSYRSKMSPELIQRFEAWSKENLDGTGLLLD